MSKAHTEAWPSEVVFNETHATVAKMTSKCVMPSIARIMTGSSQENYLITQYNAEFSITLRR